MYQTQNPGGSRGRWQCTRQQAGRYPGNLHLRYPCRQAGRQVAQNQKGRQAGIRRTQNGRTAGRQAAGRTCRQVALFQAGRQNPPAGRTGEAGRCSAETADPAQARMVETQAGGIPLLQKWQAGPPPRRWQAGRHCRWRQAEPRWCYAAETVKRGRHGERKQNTHLAGNLNGRYNRGGGSRQAQAGNAR